MKANTALGREKAPHRFLHAGYGEPLGAKEVPVA